MNQILSRAASQNGTGAILRVLLLSCCCTMLLSAQPVLTTIQDVLFRADGTRFNGTVTISWKPFVSSGSSFIPQQGLRVDVVNGVFKTKLVPTTNATAGANYEVQFASQGKYLFTETWAVPPSTVSLKVRDVRVTSGTVVGNPPVFGQLSQISDVEGLENELLLRPMRGFNFGLGRAAMINSTGQIDAVQGNLSDCVRVDGSASPCSTGDSGVGTTVGFVDGETPAGSVNSSNATFTLASTPAPAASLLLYRNGLLMRSGIDYLLSGQTITFLTQSLPQTGDSLIANYRTIVTGTGGGVGGGATTPANVPEILCSGVGGSTAQTSITDLGTCVIDPAKLQEGDRLEVKFGYNHYGTSVPSTVTVRWGTSDIFTRTATGGESALMGSVQMAISTGIALYMVESKGVVSSQQVSTGVSTESMSSPITLRLRGNMASSSLESIALRYYSVVRIPAVTSGQ